MADFQLTPQQAAVRESAATFASTVLKNAASTYERYPTQVERFRSTRPFYRRAVENGLVKYMVPSNVGGTGGSLLDLIIIIEELYTVETSVSLSIISTRLGLGPLIAGGSPKQKEEFLAPFLSGKGEPLASLMLSEPAGSANWLEKGGRGLSTVVWQDMSTGDWIIDGEKMWATNCSGWNDVGADLQCVVCRLVNSSESRDPDPLSDPKESILILLVSPEIIRENSPDAYQVISHPETAGHVAVTGPHIKFKNLRVPAKNILGAPGRGAALIQPVAYESAVIVGAMSVGIMRAAFEASLLFAKANTQGSSKLLINRQSVTDTLMDIKIKCDASRALTWAAVNALESGYSPELAIETKIFSSENATKCVIDAMSAVGVVSYLRTSPYHRLMNDALCLPLFSGGNIGVRRRQLEDIITAKNYQPWVAYSM